MKLRMAHSNSYSLFGLKHLFKWITVVILGLIHALRGTLRNLSIY